MQVRDDDEADESATLTQSTSGTRRSLLPVARGERDAGQRGDEQRAVAERAPAQAELLHRAAARLALERADRGHADEDERRRAADPDRRGEQVDDDEDGGHAARAIVRTRSAAGRAAANALVGRLELVERPPAVADDALRREVDRRRGSCASHADEVDAFALAQQPPRPRETCARASRRAGRARTRSRPTSSRSSRRSAASCVSPGSMPPPGVPHQRRVRRPGSRTGRAGRARRRRRRARAPPRASTGSSHSCSARNQCSRSAYGTAAFAGDVDGRTKSAVAPSVRSCGPSSGRSLKSAAVGLLADERDRDAARARARRARAARRRSRRGAGRPSRASSGRRRSSRRSRARAARTAPAGRRGAA